MASFKEVNCHMETALAEIGPIDPWWSEEDGMYVFEHDTYPMVCSGHATPEGSREQYIRVLRNFVRWRLDGKIADVTDQMTPGRGGKRQGAGRPVGSVKPPSIRLSLPVDIATWLKSQPEHWEQVRKLMN